MMIFYVRQISPTGHWDSFGNDWLQLLQHILNNIWINVLAAVDMLRNFQYVCRIHVVGNEIK